MDTPSVAWPWLLRTSVSANPCCFGELLRNSKSLASHKGRPGSPSLSMTTFSNAVRWETDRPMGFAFNQQRGKHIPQVVEAMPHKLNKSIGSPGRGADYYFPTADGSVAPFSKRRLPTAGFFVELRHSAKEWVPIGTYQAAEKRT